MIKDANVTQVSELRVFAHAASNFGQAMAEECRRGANLSEDALRSADYYRNFMRRKVEEAEEALRRAERALSNYESQDHTDSEGNSTYDSSYAAALRAAVSEARSKVASVKEDQQQVEQRYNLVRQQVDAMVSELTSASYTVSSAGATAYRQISEAASIIEHYDTI